MNCFQEVFKLYQITHNRKNNELSIENHKIFSEVPFKNLFMFKNDIFNQDCKYKNQKWDPLRAMKTLIRKKVGHTT